MVCGFWGTAVTVTTTPAKTDCVALVGHGVREIVEPVVIGVGLVEDLAILQGHVTMVGGPGLKNAQRSEACVVCEHINSCGGVILSNRGRIIDCRSKAVGAGKDEVDTDGRTNLLTILPHTQMKCVDLP